MDESMLSSRIAYFSRKDKELVFYFLMRRIVVDKKKTISYNKTEHVRYCIINFLLNTLKAEGQEYIRHITESICVMTRAQDGGKS